VAGKKPVPTITPAERRHHLIQSLKTTRPGRPLSKRELRDTAVFLLANPDLIEGGLFTPAICKVLAHYIKITPRRGHSAEETAEIVDLCLDMDDSQAAARAYAERATGKTAEAVKQAHLRFGRKRDKPQ
jgi:hypothetical protein